MVGCGGCRSRFLEGGLLVERRTVKHNPSHDGEASRVVQARWLVMFVAAVVIWGSVGLFVRAISLPSGCIALARGVIGVAFLSLVFGLRFWWIRRRGGDHGCIGCDGGPGSNDGGPGPNGGGQEQDSPVATRAAFGKQSTIAPGELGIMIVTGIAIGINWVLLFESYRHTTVAVATLCYYFAPILVILASPFVLKERLAPFKVVCVLVALVGVILVSGVVDFGAAGAGGAAAAGGAAGAGVFAGSGALGVGFGLGAAVFYAANMLMNKMTPHSDALAKTIVQLGSAALTMIPYLLITNGFAGLDVSTGDIAPLLILGVVHTGVAYLLYFAAIRALPAQTIAVLSYLDPATAIVLSAVFLAEPLTAAGMIGAVLILGSAMACELKK